MNIFVRVDFGSYVQKMNGLRLKEPSTINL